MIYSFIKNNEQVFPIEKMCKILQVIVEVPVEKTNNHCKTATKNCHKKTDNIDLF